MIRITASVTDGINYWDIVKTVDGVQEYSRRQPQRSGDSIQTDADDNDYIHYETPSDARPFLHVEVDGANMKPDGSWFLCNNGITFYLSIRLGPSLSDTLYSSSLCTHIAVTLSPTSTLVAISSSSCT